MMDQGDPQLSIRQLEGTMSAMKDALRLLMTACERSRDCAADVSKVGGGRNVQALGAERVLTDVLSLAKQKVEGLESTTESVLCELSAHPGPSEDAVSEDDRNRRISERIDPLFVCFLESLSQFYSSSSEHLSTLVGRREVASFLSETNSEITMQWLSAAQANNSLRAVGHLSRNELRYLVRASDNEGLPVSIMEQLTTKVHQFVNTYIHELKNLSSQTSTYKLCGGFHMHPRLIEQALNYCCSDWEAKSAGAVPAESWQERKTQIGMDVPKMSLRVDSTSFGPAAEGQREENITEKEGAIRNLVLRLADASLPPGSGRSQAIEEFTALVLLHTCPSVTNTPSKVAVQLLYGVADFIQVMPLPQKGEERPIEVRFRKNEKFEITSYSTWGLSVDNRLLNLLGQWTIDKAHCGVVEVKHVQELNLQAFVNNFPQMPPRLTVTLAQERTPDGRSHRGGLWPSHSMWPPDAPTTPPNDMLYPLSSPTSPGVTTPEEAGEVESEEGELGRFKRGKGMRVKRPQRSSREHSGSDILHHSSSDSTLQNSGSRCSTPDSSGSDAKTEDTATTVLADRGDSHPGDLLSSVLSSQSGLTQKQLQLLNVKKGKDKPGTARHLSGESSGVRSAVRRPRREEIGEKGPTGSVPRNAQYLEQSINFLSEQFDNYSLGERGSQSSGYYSPGNFSSRNGSFRSDGGDWYSLGRGNMGYPAHSGGGGPGFQPSMDQHQGGSRSPRGLSPFNTQWTGPAHQQSQLPQYKSNSSASLHLHGDQRTDSDAGSTYSASPWSDFEDYESKLSEPDFQGSDTSIFAQRSKERQANLPQPALPPGMLRSKSLEDIRKVAPSPAINSNWDSVQSVAEVSMRSEGYFPDPSDARSRYNSRSQSQSREGSVDRGMMGQRMQHPPMQRQGPPPARNYHMDMPPPHAHHPPFPEHHQMPYMEFPPGHPPPPGAHPPGPDPHFRGHPGGPYFNGPGPMHQGPRCPPPGPGDMGPGGQLPWGGPPMFQPIRYHSPSPFGPNPSPQPRPTPPETPPPMDRPYNSHPSPHPPHVPFHSGPRGPREGMMQNAPFIRHDNPPRGYPMPPLGPSPGPPGSGGRQGDRSMWPRFPHH